MMEEKTTYSESIIVHNNEEEQEELDEETLCVDSLRNWIETEAKFYGRKDDQFLLMFVRGCKMNLEKAKKKMNSYYENRKRLPQWCSHRNVKDLDPMMQKRFCSLFIERDVNLPTMAIIKYSRIGPDTGEFDGLVKHITTVLEVALRRESTQLNGAMLLIDCVDYPLWVLSKLLKPNILYNLVHCCLGASPLRLKGVHMINMPTIGRMILNMLKPMLPNKLKKRFHCYGSDWSSLLDNVDPRLLPEEFGGENGPLEEHEEAFIEEVYSYADYFIEDDKYGFQAVDN